MLDSDHEEVRELECDDADSELSEDHEGIRGVGQKRAKPERGLLRGSGAIFLATDWKIFDGLLRESGVEHMGMTLFSGLCPATSRVWPGVRRGNGFCNRPVFRFIWVPEDDFVTSLFSIRIESIPSDIFFKSDILAASRPTNLAGRLLHWGAGSLNISFVPLRLEKSVAVSSCSGVSSLSDGVEGILDGGSEGDPGGTD